MAALTAAAAAPHRSRFASNKDFVTSRLTVSSISLRLVASCRLFPPRRFASSASVMAGLRSSPGAASPAGSAVLDNDKLGDTIKVEGEAREMVGVGVGGLHSIVDIIGGGEQELSSCKLSGITERG